MSFFSRTTCACRSRSNVRALTVSSKSAACAWNIENADDVEQQVVRALGDRLYHVPGGNIATYGTQKWDPKKARTSWDPDAAAGVLASPAEKLSIDCGSVAAFGCFWLLDELDALRSRLTTSGFWVPSEKLKCIRTLGRHPIDAVHDRRVADVFAASYALYRAGQPFDNLLSDMSPEALKSYVNRITQLYRDLVSPDDHQKARQILIDLVEENIRELEELLAQHFEKDRNKAQRTIDYHGYDESRTGDGIRRHWLRFRESLERGKKKFLQYDERQGGGRAGKGDQRAQDAKPGAVDRGADGTRSVLATGSKHGCLAQGERTSRCTRSVVFGEWTGRLRVGQALASGGCCSRGAKGDYGRDPSF